MGNQNSTERPNKYDETDMTSESSAGAELVVAENSRPSASPRPTAAPAASPSQLSKTPSNSTPALMKSQSARKVRAKYGTDERSKSKPEKVVNCLQAPETRKVTRTRYEEQERAGRRHEDAVTVQTENPHSSSPHQQRQGFSKKVRVGSSNALGPYGPTRDVSPYNGDQSKSRLYGPTNSVNLANSDEPENAEEMGAAPRKQLDGDRLKQADETVANIKKPGKVSRKLFLKAKRNPETPKKDGGHFAKKPENAARSSLVLFPGLVKYMGPSRFSEDPNSQIGAEGSSNSQIFQDDKKVASLPSSSNGGKPKKDRGLGEASTKTPAKVLGQTSAVSAKIQKPRHDTIIKLENAINTPTHDLAGLSTPSVKAEIPKDDNSPSLDDGIRRSGRVRKIRHWDGENYEVHLSKKARRKSAS